MRRDEANMILKDLVESWMLDLEVQRGFCLGVMLGLLVAWGI